MDIDNKSIEQVSLEMFSWQNELPKKKLTKFVNPLI
jgi:hypothetical protein